MQCLESLLDSRQRSRLSDRQRLLAASHHIVLVAAHLQDLRIRAQQLTQLIRGRHSIRDLPVEDLRSQNTNHDRELVDGDKLTATPAGETSAMYIGERFEATPMPTPPIQRAILNESKLQANAVPMAEIVNRNPAAQAAVYDRTDR